MRLGLLAVLTVSTGLAVSGAVSAQSVMPSAAVEPVARPTTLSAHFRTLAYSAYDPSTGQYRLRVTVGSAPPRDVPVAPRRVPFDVDAGRAYAPQIGHEEVLVYSRCAHEPALTGHRDVPVVEWRTARDCHLYRTTLAGGEQRIAGTGDEVLPTLSGSTLAAVRERADREPDVVVRRLHGRPVAPVVVHGLATHGAEGPVALDAYGGRIAITWRYAARTGSSFVATRLFVVGRDGHEARTVRSLGGGGLSTSTIVGASWADGTLRWAERCDGDPSGCDGRRLLGAWVPSRRPPAMTKAPSATITAFASNGATAWTLENCPIASTQETGSGCVIRRRP